MPFSFYRRTKTGIQPLFNTNKDASFGMKTVKVLNSRTFSGSVTGNSWSLHNGDDDEDEGIGTEAEAEPGGGSRRHQPAG